MIIPFEVSNVVKSELKVYLKHPVIIWFSDRRSYKAITFGGVILALLIALV